MAANCKTVRVKGHGTRCRCGNRFAKKARCK